MKPGNLLHIKTLNEEWWDKDVVLLHACFQVLESYIEEEDPFNYWDWSETAERQQHKQQLEALYAWWQSRKAREEAEGSLDLDPAMYAEDTQKLKELMDLRHLLWT